MNGLYNIISSEKTDEVPAQRFASRGPILLEVDERNGIVTIEGVRYSFDFFRALAYGVMKGQLFEMGERKDGVVEIRQVILEKPQKMSQTGVSAMLR